MIGQKLPEPSPVACAPIVVRDIMRVIVVENEYYMTLKKILFFVSVLVYGLPSFAQPGQASVVGFVHNEQNEPLPAVSIRFPELGRSTLTDENGRFELSNLPTGIFKLLITQIGKDSLETSIDVKEQNSAFYFKLKASTTTLNQVSVFGYSANQEANRQAYNITAIDAKKFHNTTSDIAHVLDRVPGARLRETGGLGSDFDFSISGFSGKRIKFFVDGVPMDDFGSSFQINNIPINFAERIEVYKGVVPVWLGSDALGGAVNIITNNSMRNYLDVSYAYGSFNTHRSYINAGYTGANGFAVRLNAFQNHSDNDYKVTLDAADIHTGRYVRDTTLRRFHDQYHNETLIAQVGFVDKKWADELLAGITLGQYYNEIQNGATMDVVFGAWHEKGNIVMPSLKYRKKDLLIDGLDVVLNANYNLGNIQNVDTVHARYGWLGDLITYRGKGGELWYSHYKYRNNNANANATVLYKVDDRQTLALNNSFSHFNRKGTNFVSEGSKIDNLPQKTDKNILGLSYQYHLSRKFDATAFGKYYIQKGNTELVDIDYTREQDTLYIQKNTNVTKFGYGMAVSYFTTPSLQFKLSYEKTNRLPDGEELFGDVVYREGNWNLKPESSNNFNLGISYTVPIGSHRFYISSTGIYRNVDNFIVDAFNALENKITSQNLLKVSSTGIESEIKYSYKEFLTISTNLTYQNITDRARYRTDVPEEMLIPSSTFEERLPNIPYLFGNADALVMFKDVFNVNDRLTIGYNLLYVHAFYLYWEKQAALDTKRTIPRQVSHDVNLAYTLGNSRYNIGLECKNLTNVQLYDNFSLQKPGRAVHLKIRYFLNK